ncbi:sigma-54 dependent transcriptional regulator [Myxococcota bacterium]|nr:sigma-54 dependent transcriptional regulator [Myxococcota bacterium]MBU1429294.1 sigma-54 dependent transcriptional regulator [Myxococcota bacterium]MBU1898863.1 sigma-54 dependent transcriptional regulator [Myxococcota bacterium]
MSPPRVLLIEDDDSLRQVLAINLEDHDFIVDQAPDGAAGLALYDPLRHDVVLTDLRMPEVDGLGVLEGVLARDPTAAVVVLTAFGGTEQALEAMRRGAFHYVEKPLHTGALIATLRRAMAARLSPSAPRRPEIIAASPAMNRALRIVDKVAHSEAPVMILGESGVGKELIARAIHQRGGRAAGPFVAINCAAIPGELLESALFGHEKGAFTGANARRDGKFSQANGGTLFLDEIAEMSPRLQSKLLRALQERRVDRLGGAAPEPFDARILTATHQDLKARIAQGVFREDLYYRLHVVPLEVPPLRARREDIPVLTRHFLRQLAPGVGVSRAVDEALMGYAWPGNIRELRAVVERMLLLRDGPDLEVEDVPPELRAPPQPQGLPFALPDEGFDLIAHEIAIIRAALEKTGGRRAAAARYLHLPRHVLIYRLEKYGLTDVGRDERGAPR